MRDLIQGNHSGKFFLIYGPTGVGKTTSALATLPQSILGIMTEPRDPQSSLDAIEDKVDVQFKVPESFEDLQEFLAQEASKPTHDYRSLLFDSASYWMNVSLSQDIEDQTFDAEIFGKAKRKLVDMTRKDQAAFGSLSSLMKRSFKLLGQISQSGVVVVVTALVIENPKWNRELAASPAFLGQDFPVNSPSYFDAIGFLSQRFDDTGNPVYPPNVAFEGDGFVSKWTGKRGKRLVGPLDFRKILSL